MDINDLRGLATVLAMMAFIAVSYWAYSGRKKQDFEEAAQLPFADDIAYSGSAKNKSSYQMNNEQKDNNKGVTP